MVDSVDGVVAVGFEAVREAFEQVVSGQAGTGAAVAIWHDGRWVADLWGGTADVSGRRRWQRESIAMTYSVSKAFTATCALVLVDRGLLDLDSAVQRYWPELRTEATVRQLLSHQVGLVALDGPAPQELLYDWDGLCGRLAAMEPLWATGTAIGESALFYGHLVGEVVRRVDGRGLGTFLRDEVCGPEELDFFVGLGDAELPRAVDLTQLETLRERVLAPGADNLRARALLNPPGAVEAAVVNSERWRRAEVPAVNGHGTARAVAGLYARLLEGQILSPALRDEAATAQARGVDRVVGGPERAWGLGFAVEPDGFGMGGSGGSLGWACVDGRYAYGFVTGTMGGHDRSDAVENALRDVIGLPPL
jgi:CubicO group peptidase (beta-lactamase class C family)